MTNPDLPKPGERVRYRSIAGHLYPADVVAVRLDGLVDIDVAVRPPLRLRKRRWFDGPAEDAPITCCAR